MAHYSERARRADGQQLSLDAYRGKAVVFLFHLGSGCLHGVEPLRKFARLTGQFAAPGHLEPCRQQRVARYAPRVARRVGGGETSSFLLAANPKLGDFLAYRACDDFENGRLHAAYPIAAQGLVRWRNIGFKPVNDARFVPGEAGHRLGQR